jgi:hypothetical protein
MAGSSDKSIALDTENVRDIGAMYTVGYSNATDRQKLRFQSSALGSDQPNDDLAAELQSYAICRLLALLGSQARFEVSP